MGDSDFIQAAEEQIAAAERAIARALAEDIFSPIGYPEPVRVAVSAWRRLTMWLRQRWYAFREWLAVHMLRVDIHQDREDE